MTSYCKSNCVCVRVCVCALVRFLNSTECLLVRWPVRTSMQSVSDSSRTAVAAAAVAAILAQQQQQLLLLPKGFPSLSRQAGLETNSSQVVSSRLVSPPLACCCYYAASVGRSIESTGCWTQTKICTKYWPGCWLLQLLRAWSCVS